MGLCDERRIQSNHQLTTNLRDFQLEFGIQKFGDSVRASQNLLEGPIKRPISGSLKESSLKEVPQQRFTSRGSPIEISIEILFWLNNFEVKQTSKKPKVDASKNIGRISEAQILNHLVVEHAATLNRSLTMPRKLFGEVDAYRAQSYQELGKQVYLIRFIT